MIKAREIPSNGTSASIKKNKTHQNTKNTLTIWIGGIFEQAHPEFCHAIRSPLISEYLSNEKEVTPKETPSLAHNIPEELLEQIKGLDAPENELSVEQELQKMGRDSGKIETSPEKESNDLEIELDR